MAQKVACTAHAREEHLEEGGRTTVPAGDPKEAGSIDQAVDPEEEDTIQEGVVE
jgi:hypothetical protein